MEESESNAYMSLVVRMDVGTRACVCVRACLRAIGSGGRRRNSDSTQTACSGVGETSPFFTEIRQNI